MLQKQKTFLFKKFILIITFLISWESSLAQGDQSTFDKEQTITRNLEDALLEINQLVISKQSNQAIAKSGPILDQLKLEEKYNSPIGLRARLLHGAALIHADTSKVSFDFLWKLKDDSKASKEWVVFAETCRIIASILEYSGRKAQSLGNLEEARYTIFKHKLDSIYPSFAVRISSWHRIFGDQDSSIY
jgi:hypothetical protein